MNINGSNLRRPNLIESSAAFIKIKVGNQYLAHELSEFEAVNVSSQVRYET